MVEDTDVADKVYQLGSSVVGIFLEVITFFTHNEQIKI